jgi:hypothetical protein
VVEEDAPHRGGGDGEEVGPAPPFDLPLVGQAQEGLVDQGRGLQRVIPPLAGEVAAGDASQLTVDEGQQLFACSAVAGAPPLQQRGDLGLAGWRGSIDLQPLPPGRET